MGDTAYGRDGEFYAAARLHLIRHGFAVTPVSLRVGRSAGLTRHRRVIQHREPLKGKANGGTPFNAADRQWEGLGDKKKRPGGASFGFVYRFLAVQVRPVRDRSDRAA